MENNNINIKCILGKLEQDGDGVWKIRLIADCSQGEKILELSKYTQTILDINITPENEKVFGQIKED